MLPLTFNNNIVLLVPATWMDWSPWSDCSITCGAGGFRNRSRGVTPGKHNMCNKANLKPDEGDSEETQMCSTETIPDWPTCPTPAHEGSWGEWTPCKQTCIEEGSERPQTMRVRDCVEAKPSSNETLNAGLRTCNDLVPSRELKNCETPTCPGEIEIILRK